MSNRIYICGIKGEYIEYLRHFDDTVRIDLTGTRKYIGILFKVNGQKYYAPLASPKKKYYRISDKALDLYKLDGGKLGVINLNNMIPVPDSAVIFINIEDEPNYKYRNLLRDQARIIMSNREVIKNKAKVLYSVVNSGEQPNLNKRCSKFKLLEEKCKIYEVEDEVAATQNIDHE